MADKKYLIRFGYSHRYLKSYTTTEEGDVDDIETTIHQDRAIKLDLNEAMEYVTDLFKFLKPEVVEKQIEIKLKEKENYKIKKKKL